MLVVAQTLYKIAMSQYAIDANQTWTAMHWLSALGKDPLTARKDQPLML